jgi:hypothetical protein
MLVYIYIYIFTNKLTSFWCIHKNKAHHKHLAQRTEYGTRQYQDFSETLFDVAYILTAQYTRKTIKSHVSIKFGEIGGPI